jgi:hypothetical protein
MGLWGRLRGLGGLPGLRLGEAAEEVPDRKPVGLGVGLHYAEGTLRVGIPMPSPGLVDRVEGGVAEMFAYVVSHLLASFPPLGLGWRPQPGSWVLRVITRGIAFILPAPREFSAVSPPTPRTSTRAASSGAPGP